MSDTKLLSFFKLFYFLNIKLFYFLNKLAGDQKVSVSCVEDGVSHPSTRLVLGYGDMTIWSPVKLVQ